MPLNVFIVVVFVGAWTFSRLANKLGLPGILGMLIFGIVFANFFRGTIPPLVWELAPFLTSFALIVILLRAGLGIQKHSLMKVGKTAILMAVIPCLLEAIILTLVFMELFQLPFLSAAIGAFILSAVSPAVVVPSMLNLKDQGYGKEHEIPTLILAAASIDDVIAITCFSLFLALGTEAISSGLSMQWTFVDAGLSALQIPLSIFGGILLGAFGGLFLAAWFKRHHENIRATEKTILLLMVAIMFVEIGHNLHIAAFLAVMTLGFFLLEKAELVAHELAEKLSKIWVPSEILLFVLIGFAVHLSTAFEAGLKGLLLIGCGLLARSVGVWISTAFDKQLSKKERLFCVFAYIPKATVQAALGAIPLAAGIYGGEILLAIAVLAIVVTAPLGLILIRTFGPKLLA